MVLEAQLAAIREVKPGQHWNHPHDVTVRVITEGLRDLGLLDGEPNELIELAAYRTFYMHRAGHWLGLDVHDVGDYKIGGEWRVLEPGMVLTVEPGIYIAPDNRACGEEVARHRHPHRGRRGGHEERVQGAHGGRAEVRARHRTADGGRGMSADSYDIVIVGGGMVGASLACALAAGGRFSRVALVEGFPLLERTGPAVYQPSFDARSTALSLSSERFLAALGLWDEVRRHAQPIRQHPRLRPRALRLDGDGCRARNGSRRSATWSRTSGWATCCTTGCAPAPT